MATAAGGTEYLCIAPHFSSFSFPTSVVSMSVPSRLAAPTRHSSVRHWAPTCPLGCMQARHGAPLCLPPRLCHPGTATRLSHQRPKPTRPNRAPALSPGLPLHRPRPPSPPPRGSGSSRRRAAGRAGLEAGCATAAPGAVSPPCSARCPSRSPGRRSGQPRSGAGRQGGGSRGEARGRCKSRGPSATGAGAERNPREERGAERSGVRPRRCLDARGASGAGGRRHPGGPGEGGRGGRGGGLRARRGGSRQRWPWPPTLTI